MPDLGEINNEMIKQAEYASTVAKEKFGRNLDFSEDSLAQLETLLDQAYQRFSQLAKEGKLRNESVQKTANVWGSYLGEVVRRKWGGTWSKKANDATLVIDGNDVSPIAFVYQRITRQPQYKTLQYYADVTAKLKARNQKQSPPNDQYTSQMVRGLFDYVANATVKQHGNPVKRVAEEYIRKKQQEYQGQDYLDQIEKNAIYLGEGTWAVSMAIRRFLAQGEPILEPDEVTFFVFETRLTHPQEVVSLHLNYLRNNCAGCPVHAEHTRYENWRKLRLSGNRAKYVDELEYSCKYYQATYVLAQQFLSSFLLNQDLAGSARNIPANDLAGIIDERVFAWTDLFLAGRD